MRIVLTYIDSNNCRATDQFQLKTNSLEYNEFNSRRINKQIGNTSCPFMFLEESKTCDGNYFIYHRPSGLEGQADNFDIHCY